MRARHRHFNAKDVGASGVYDARFISGLANNASVSAWNSRTGTNNATQGTAANQPIYKTNQFNGNPVVEFDGTSDRLDFSRLDATSAWALCIFKRTSANTYQQLFQIQNTAGTNPAFTAAIHSDTNYGPLICGNGGNVFYGKGGGLRQGEWRSAYFVWLGGGNSGAVYYQIWDDGSIITLANSSNVGNDSRASSYIGRDVGPIGGQMALCIFALISSTNSIRKRVSHAAAYSFKLASS